MKNHHVLAGTVALSLLCLTVISTVASDYTYVTNGNGSLTITGYIGAGGDIVIPGEIEGRTVEVMGEKAF